MLVELQQIRQEKSDCIFHFAVWLHANFSNFFENILCYVEKVTQIMY